MTTDKTLLVTGGAGYIGSHTCLELCATGHHVVILDNLSNSSPKAVDSMLTLSNGKITFVRGDLLDARCLTALFSKFKVDAVLHFAGLKAVGESVSIPIKYYNNNITGTLNLLQAMTEANVRSLVFSSSATVYGEPERVPITENFPLSATNPYGRSKLMIEQILTDLCHSDESWKISLLRYFNPVGAHPSGDLGEDPSGTPNNLMPYIAQVAVGRLPKLRIFGDDYPTPDGTGIRDYIHVVDLARGHLAALDHLEAGCFAYNLGSGHGYSVFEALKAFEAVAGRRIPFEVVARRAGDIAVSYADPGKANRELGWQTQKSLQDMCQDAWRWQSRHPDGFK